MKIIHQYSKFFGKKIKHVWSFHSFFLWRSWATIGRPMSKQRGTFRHHYEVKRKVNPKILGYLINMHIVLHVKQGKESSLFSFCSPLRQIL